MGDKQKNDKGLRSESESSSSSDAEIGGAEEARLQERVTFLNSQVSYDGSVQEFVF